MPLLYTPFKIFHYPEKIDSLSPNVQKVTSPIHVRIKPINICNHNCWYCAYRADNLQLGESMNLKDQIPEHKMSEIIEDFIDMDVKAITFSVEENLFFINHYHGSFVDWQRVLFN